MKTIGHHTCRKSGSIASVLENAPFESPHTKKEPKFLGTGYYLWDYNLKYAKTYGQMHYPEGFYVVSINLNLPSDIFLDLAGNRMHMEILLELKKQLIEDYEIEMEQYENQSDNEDSGNKFCLGTFIEILKRLEKADGVKGKIFPYKAVRAMDHWNRREEKEIVHFRPDMGNITDMNPRFIICLYEKNNLLLPPGGTKIEFEGNAQQRTYKRF